MSGPVDIGIASLADVQPVTVDGTRRTPEDRVEQIVSLAVLADELGLDHFGLGEHHNPDFAVSSPAVVPAAIASRTSRVRLTSSVPTLSALDPVRGYQDFATLDVLSAGRAEITAGRSAYPEPFRLFGVPLRDYDDAFEEKLGLLLNIRARPVVTWEGRFRPPLDDAAILPRAVQEPLPVWLGVGGHYFGAPSTREATAVYPCYRDFLRPKHPGGGGFLVTSEQFELGTRAGQHLMIGTAEHVSAKLAELHDVLRFDRVPSWPRRHPEGRLPLRVARGIADDDRETRRVDHQTVSRCMHPDGEGGITVRAVPHREDG
ncbi:LLM class flavin-dependent oxidoreductase [Amycolatopsis sp. CA-126428]|uniref:LLM class flavin-dependent oxidoreductase n=1 Tax=Amycolatopsis sp. CA-126428 TaxID=2073158 RepID=UPI0018ECBD5B|nr:LLM class flavin-dependent oxidoreductase [Amycolatopsis sp. CA-126428]